jgi:hypothetical protein
MTTPTEWLVDLESVRRFPQRYARAVDQRDHDALAALFDPDGSIDGTFGLESVVDYLEGMRTRLGSGGGESTSMHLLGDPLVDLEPGADTAHLDTYAVVYQFPDGSDAFTLGMRYLDELVRLDDGWRIHFRKTERIWMK